MNSWMSSKLSAWAPPLRMFIMGMGSTRALARPGTGTVARPALAAAARATAMDTPRMALAPALALLGVPSAVEHGLVEPGLVKGVQPTTLGASELDVVHSLEHALPPIALGSPSRNSSASCSPVEAPDGTAATAARA